MPEKYDQNFYIDLTESGGPVARRLGKATLGPIGPDAQITDLSDALQKQTLANDPDNQDMLPSRWEGTLESDDYSTEHLAEFVQTAFAWRNAQTEHRGEGARYNYIDILDTLRSAPSAKLQAVYSAEAGGTELHTMIEHSIETDSLPWVLDFYKKLYGVSEAIKLGDPRSPTWDDPQIRKLFGKKKIIHVLLNEFKQDYARSSYDDYDEYGDELEEKPERPNRAQYDYARQFLRDIAHLPKSCRDELLFSAHSRIHDTDHPADIDTYKLARMLETTAKNARALGNRAIRRLRKDAGIINLDYRSAEDLKLMHNVIRGDASTIKHLQAGDVTVVFTDEVGDHNGAFEELTAQYATPHNRTLSFGVSKPGDIYRHMALLRKLGVKPSTIAIGAHGSPGSMVIGDVKITNSDVNKSTLEPRLSLSMARGLTRIFDERMQDSRDIDAPDELKGRRRIILDSCSQARQVDAVQRQVYQNGSHRRRIRRAHVKESVPETLLRKTSASNFDVYSSDEPMAAIPTKDGMGVQFLFFDPLTERPYPGVVTLHNRDEESNIITTYTDRIPVRKPPIPEKEAA